MRTPRKILVIATRQIGDVLITTPLIHRAREIWPHAIIDILGYKGTMGMLEGNTDLGETIESSEHPCWAEYRILLMKIFRKYDLAIVTQPSDRAHLYGLLAARNRVGIIPPKVSHNWWKRLLCSHTVVLDYFGQHVVAERFRLLEQYDPLPKRRPEVIAPAAQDLPRNIQDLLRTPYVVIHATPRWHFKRWTISGWTALIKRLILLDIQVILTGSSSRQDHEINASIQASVNAIEGKVKQGQLLNISGQLSLAQTGTLLRRASGYIGVDTSVTHLAAACGTKVVGLFGATPPTNYGPWPINCRDLQPWRKIGEQPADKSRMQTNGNIRIVQGPGHCVPCRKAGCLDKFESHSDCLDHLNSEDVTQMVISHLGLGKT